MHETFHSPTLTLGLAMAIGVICQSLARRANVPGIVFLLAAGVLLGPDVLNLVRPNSLGSALYGVIGFGVAVVLFEGGLNQNIARLRRQAKPIRRLVTIGALLTAGGSAYAAHLFLGWHWRMSVLFGTLVIVTGPTVITPLLRRIRVNYRVATVLDAEGIFIDAIGAVIAIAALEFTLDPSALSAAQSAVELAARIAIGSLVGAGAGLFLYLALGKMKAVPSGLENIFTLSIVILAFELGNSLLPESGLVASIMCGMIVGNTKMSALDELSEFKEQLSVLLIAVLFVLLAADVRLSDLYALGTPALLTVAAMMFVVRPVNVFVCTIGTKLTFNEKLFLSWLAPRGIVAAAIASLFALELSAAGIEGGKPVRAMVFLVIATTVTLQGLSGGLVAKLLGVNRPGPRGFVIIGANALGRAIGTLLRAHGEPVRIIDTNPRHCRLAEEAGLLVIRGNALQESILARARVDSVRTVICVTSSEKINFMAARSIAQEHKGPRVLAITDPTASLVTDDMLEQIGAEPMLAAGTDLKHWLAGMRRGDGIELEDWQWHSDEALDQEQAFRGMPVQVVLPLMISDDEYWDVTAIGTTPKDKDVVTFAVWRTDDTQTAVADAWFDRQGWTKFDPDTQTSKRMRAVTETSNKNLSVKQGSEQRPKKAASSNIDETEGEEAPKEDS